MYIAQNFSRSVFDLLEKLGKLTTVLHKAGTTFYNVPTMEVIDKHEMTKKLKWLLATISVILTNIQFAIYFERFPLPQLIQTIAYDAGIASHLVICWEMYQIGTRSVHFSTFSGLLK